jgi:hypothetical protein
VLLLLRSRGSSSSRSCLGEARKLQVWAAKSGSVDCHLLVSGASIQAALTNIRRRSDLGGKTSDKGFEPDGNCRPAKGINKLEEVDVYVVIEVIS